MFVYYYVHLERPFEEVEQVVLRMIPGLRGWADAAYREGEYLQVRIGPKRIAKTVEMSAGAPARGANETWIPVVWEATGAPALFPRMEADVVVAAVGTGLTQIALRGSYTVPLGKVGGALDRMILHRIAETSVKSFVDRIALSVDRDLRTRVSERECVMRKPSVLIVTADPDERRRIGLWLDQEGYDDVMACPGPSAPDYTCLGGRGADCPLAREADIVVVSLHLRSDAAMAGTPGWHLMLYYYERHKQVIVLAGDEDPVHPWPDDHLHLVARPSGRAEFIDALASASAASALAS